MKKLIDVPDEHIESIKKIAKIKRWSVKSYMENAVVSMALLDLIKLKKSK